MLDKLATVTQKISPGLRQLIGNTAWLFADKILQLGLSLFVGIWVARYLGPDQFGLLSYATTLVALFGPIASLGLAGIVVRDLTREESAKNEILGTAFALQLIGGLVSLVLTVGTIFILRPDDNYIRALVGLVAAATIFQAFETISLWFQFQIQSKYTVFAKNTAYLLICLVRIALIQAQAPLMAFAWARLAETALGAVGLVLVYQLRGQHVKMFQFSLARAKSLLKDSWPLILAGLSTYIYATIDQVMLGQMTNFKSLSIYAVAVKISEIFNFIPTVIGQSVLPKVVKKYEEGEKPFLDSMQNVFDIMAVFWFFIAVVVSSLSSWIVYVLYGNAYSGSAVVLSIYVWAQFGSNFGTARYLYITVKGLFRLSLVISVAGAVINIILNYFLIPLYQEIGATVATLITYFVAVILMNVILKDLRPLVPLILKSLLIHKSLLRLWRTLRGGNSVSL